ncbi:MAG: cell division protein [Epsilonproteobacteria bacterium]|jgi:parvulin-like peptidyl-prolyl isomerase|nr:cell division protein [Campylobacterota bacterium]NPA89154.1 cell division protein [Campylobacterota bacterium]
MVKKIVMAGLTAGLLMAFPGMKGMMGGHGGLNGKPMKGLTDSTVLATLNGKPITVKDVNNYLQGITGDPNIKLQQLPAQHVKPFVKEYIKTHLIYQKAKSVTTTPQFQELMKKIADDYWYRTQLNTIKISDEEAKAFYEKNKDIYFKTTPKVKVRHILVKDEKEAEKLLAQLKGLHGKALEEKFAQLAKKYSIGPSKVNGGELGWIDPNQMVKPFAQAVEKMKPGELSPKPVKTRFGYHIILVEGKKNNSYIPFKEVKTQIVEYLKRAKLKKEIDQVMKSAKVEYKIK